MAGSLSLHVCPIDDSNSNKQQSLTSTSLCSDSHSSIPPPTDCIAAHYHVSVQSHMQSPSTQIDWCAPSIIRSRRITTPTRRSSLDDQPLIVFCPRHSSESLRWVAKMSTRPRLRCRLCSGQATRQWRRSHPGQCAWQNLVLRAKRRVARMAMSSCSDAYGLTSDASGSDGDRLGQAMVGQVRGSDGQAQPVVSHAPLSCRTQTRPPPRQLYQQ